MSDTSFFPYSKPALNETDIQEVVKSLHQTTITRGPLVEAFEKSIADYCEAKYAVAFNNATSALMACYFAADIGPHDKVISIPNTFVATIGYAVSRGATPVFLDIDLSTGNLNLEHLYVNLENKLSRGRFFITPVHFAGPAIDMKKIDRLIENPATVVIEDAAHAIGSLYPSGEKVGSCTYSDMTVFSFHAVKTITTGEGGMVTTNDENLYRRLKLFRNNGVERQAEFLENEPAPWYYEVQELTGNYNFTEFQAALGLSQMQRLDKIIQEKRELVKHYNELLKDHPHIKLLSTENIDNASYHLCVAKIDFEACGKRRKDVMEKLFDQGIGTQVHYIPLYKHPVIRKICGTIDEYFPQMELYYSQALSLPLYPGLTKRNVDYIVDQLKKVLK
jgi:UDP-4-amino-4,6-dideoxy-N-acetyl-beta-L-altrosamine transaminase